MHLSLIVPAPFDAVSGGYAYDRRIVAGLREAGHTVKVVELAGVASAGRRGRARCGPRGVARAARGNPRPIIDGLALPAFAGMDAALAARNAVGLIHHPTALETGLREAESAMRLRAIEKRLLPKLARVIVTSETTGERLAADFGVEAAAHPGRGAGHRRCAAQRRLGRPDLRHHLGRHAGAAQGP